MVMAHAIARTPGEIAAGLAGMAMIGLILFGLTLFGIGGFFLLRVMRAYCGGRDAEAGRERAEGARAAREMAFASLICGPVLGGGMWLLLFPVLVFLPDFRFPEYLVLVLVMVGVGMIAGLIAGGAFRVTGVCLGRVRKVLKTWKRGGVWDAEFDGPV